MKYRVFIEYSLSNGIFYLNNGIEYEKLLERKIDIMLDMHNTINSHLRTPKVF